MSTDVTSANSNEERQQQLSSFRQVCVYKRTYSSLLVSDTVSGCVVWSKLSTICNTLTRTNVQQCVPSLLILSYAAAWRGALERQRYRELQHSHKQHLLKQQQQKQNAAASTVQRGSFRCYAMSVQLKRMYVHYIPLTFCASDSMGMS